MSVSVDLRLNAVTRSAKRDITELTVRRAADYPSKYVPESLMNAYRNTL